MEETVQPICVTSQMITVGGHVHYTDKRRRIELKKPVRDLFSHIKGNVSYIMEICLDSDKVQQRVDELKKQNIRPTIIYFLENEETKNEMP